MRPAEVGLTGEPAGVQPVRRRRSHISSASQSGTRLGLVRGRDGRSSRQASVRRFSSLAARQRRTHSQQVHFATFEQAAACSNVNPSSSTNTTVRSGPVGVSTVLRCCIPGLRECREP